ncbi:hypothetical protein [Bartonella sp. F02]|uniref:hypothetical protein n=1 Tax=Bartonella sp. F02 TaxID=2967262 RepID=UPI0022A94832|nr:hypothetical protein [Bartonella sp. F02]MCZ2328252.1 hypothetical protein [Bartonella sp. F02]
MNKSFRLLVSAAVLVSSVSAFAVPSAFAGPRSGSTAKTEAMLVPSCSGFGDYSICSIPGRTGIYLKKGYLITKISD